ncbi:hypothetical protein FA15DRAFT_716903 [Coprinopsis marcescibilis]|uniref:Uncharacterized protein n=1 Tax=Coprinopsis marcescibilis TaxID=230819 RepID=A0A5C3KZW9_COPMA|nr:hypothetical protein FA15DRAFT_716903 [Coprinopsis marcescibilis]
MTGTPEKAQRRPGPSAPSIYYPSQGITVPAILGVIFLLVIFLSGLIFLVHRLHKRSVRRRELSAKAAKSQGQSGEEGDPTRAHLVDLEAGSAAYPHKGDMDDANLNGGYSQQFVVGLSTTGDEVDTQDDGTKAPGDHLDDKVEPEWSLESAAEFSFRARGIPETWSSDRVHYLKYSDNSTSDGDGASVTIVDFSISPFDVTAVPLPPLPSDAPVFIKRPIERQDTIPPYEATPHANQLSSTPFTLKSNAKISKKANEDSVQSFKSKDPNASFGTTTTSTSLPTAGRSSVATMGSIGPPPPYSSRASSLRGGPPLSSQESPPPSWRAIYKVQGRGRAK